MATNGHRSYGLSLDMSDPIDRQAAYELRRWYRALSNRDKWHIAKSVRKYHRYIDKLPANDRRRKMRRTR